MSQKMRYEILYRMIVSTLQTDFILITYKTTLSQKIDLIIAIRMVQRSSKSDKISLGFDQFKVKVHQVSISSEFQSTGIKLHGNLVSRRGQATLTDKWKLQLSFDPGCSVYMGPGAVGSILPGHPASTLQAHFKPSTPPWTLFDPFQCCHFRL